MQETGTPAGIFYSLNTKDETAPPHGRRFFRGKNPRRSLTPTREVINCHCVLIPDVLMPGERLKTGGESGIIITDRQLGHKAGKHMSEWGLNPAEEKDREKFADITRNIQANPQEIRRVQWLHDPETGKRTVEVNAYIVGKDVVLVKDDKEYITTMKNGIDNERVKRGRRVE